MEVWHRRRREYNKMSEVDDISIVRVMNSVKFVKYMFDIFRLVFFLTQRAPVGVTQNKVIGA